MSGRAEHPTVASKEPRGADEQAPPREEAAWHALTAEDTLAQLEADAEGGLSEEEAERRLAEYGPNRLEESEGRPWWQTLLDQFRSPLIYILLIAAVVTLLLEEYVDAGVIAAVLVLNAAIGFYQERQAEQAVQALMDLVSPTATVLRDGVEQEVDAERVVPGDVVLLESGGKVPADARLLRASSLQVDESLLTGESTAVGKDPEPVDEDAPVAERSCLVFDGTAVASGRARGVVVATGEATELGKIAEQMREAEELSSPLAQRMGRFANIIGLIILVSVLVTVAYGLLIGEPLGEMLLIAAALAVATVPEALPVVLTVALALGVRRMAQRRAIVRRLPAVETLGSATFIGSDKTGTLTRNEMTVQEVWVAGRTHDLTDAPEDPREAEARELPEADAEPAVLAMLAGALANEAELELTDDGVETRGDPTETALLLAAARSGYDVGALGGSWVERAQIPFESQRQYAASYRERDGAHHVFVKGAPERVLGMCRDLAGDGIDEDAVRDAQEDMAGRGLRVLATAYARLDAAPDADEPAEPADLTFLGLHGLLDPPREGVKEAIAAARRAGQRVVMITGDHAATARAIARDLGIVADDDAKVLTGRELADCSDDDLDEAVAEVAVFARVEPGHKLRIVEAAQRRGEVVAVTGDGVNDAPALKRADIGVSMGQAGTDVAREASEVVLTDDNFVTIESAIEEGRVTFDNVRKVTFFLISTGVGTFLIVPATLLLGWPLILVPAQLLWANVVTKGLQDLALAFEAGEPDVLDQPPRGKQEPVITGPLWIRTVITGVVIAIGTLALYGWALGQEALNQEQARTVALSTLVVFQAFHLFSSRSELRSVFTMSLTSNRFLFLAQAGALVVHVAALYLPATQFVLRVEPIPLGAWGLIVAVSLSVLVVVELEKLIRRRFGLAA